MLRLILLFFSFASVLFCQITQGPGGPVLLIGTAANPFSYYYAEILRTEGLNEFATADISTVTAATLAGYDVVILGEMSLSAAQVSMLTSWVTAGGNLIAMRPDRQLSSLLGLASTGANLTNAYLLVDSTTSAGTGIVNQTIQFHGTADRYVLAGANAIAYLYQNLTTSTLNPAVSLNAAGAGAAAAFTYDLARSVVYTRQGNPVWVGQQRDAFWGTFSPLTPHNLFFGGATFDPQPDWIDFNRSAIPQADEQQRLLINLIEAMNGTKKPLPRFWYLPFGFKAAVLMTGDDHNLGGTAGRFSQYIASSIPGCSVANWECIRSTSYTYNGNPLLANAQAITYTAAGFEVALHAWTNCAPWTPSLLDSFFTTQLQKFQAYYPGLPAPVTDRTHCSVWSDWVSEPKVELSHGIRLDMNYATGPSTWVQDRVGLMNGSGMPMRFADTDGTMLDIYQGFTHLWDTDYSPTASLWINNLLDQAIGTKGYFGVIGILAHTDNAYSEVSNTVVAAAGARGVPIVSSKQMLTWLDARNSSSFSSISWQNGALSFSVTAAPGSNGLQAMVPASFNGASLLSISTGVTPVSYLTKPIKGINYAVFNTAGGSYKATYTSSSTSAITVSPQAASLSSAQTQQFTASGSAAWSISPSIGNISATGMYTAPSTIAAIQPVTVTAVSVTDSTKFATAAITLLPAAAPAITQQPASVSVTVGQSAVFSVVAAGAGLSYQWQAMAPGGSFTAIGGAVSNSYTTAPTHTTDNGTLFRCVITSSGGSATSAGATLSVMASGTGFVTSSSPKTPRNNYNGWVGMGITVGSAPIAITALGRMFTAGNTGTHVVKIVNASSGVDVPGGSASVNMAAGGTPGAFLYGSLASPVLLAANASYYIVSEETSGADQWFDFSTTVQTANVATVSSAVYGLPYTRAGTTGNVYGPVDFQYTQPRTTVVSTLGTLRNNYSGWVGMKITVAAAPITVTALGRIVAPGNTGRHVIKIADASSGSDIAGASATVDTTTAPAGASVYAALGTPVTLNANASYYILSQEVLGGDFWYDWNTVLQSGSDISLSGAVFSATPPVYTVVSNSAGHSYVPVDFVYSH